MSLCIRHARPGDIPRLAELERLCFSSPWSEKSLSDFAANPDACLLTAEDDGVLLGYAGAFLSYDESDIANVATAPEARRRGIARALMTALAEELRARGAARAYLEVRESNTPALTLYTALGFSEVGRRRGYYTAPREDAILMARDL